MRGGPRLFVDVHRLLFASEKQQVYLQLDVSVRPDKDDWELPVVMKLLPLENLKLPRLRVNMDCCRYLYGHTLAFHLDSIIVFRCLCVPTAFGKYTATKHTKLIAFEINAGEWRNIEPAHKCAKESKSPAHAASGMSCLFALDKLLKSAEPRVRKSRAKTGAKGALLHCRHTPPHDYTSACQNMRYSLYSRNERLECLQAQQYRFIVRWRYHMRRPI